MKKKTKPRMGRPPLERVPNWNGAKYLAKCRERGYTMADVGERVGVSADTAGSWVRRAPSVEQGPRVAKALGTRLHLLCGEDEE